MMSKYEAKQKRKYEETESGKISYAMWEHRREIEKLSPDDWDISLVDDVKISRDNLSYIISRAVPDKANRYLLKFVPVMEHSIDRRIDILNAQPWYYL